MSWKLRTYILSGEEEIFEHKEDAEAEADHIMYMQPGEVLATVEEYEDDEDVSFSPSPSEMDEMYQHYLEEDARDIEVELKKGRKD